MADRLGPSHACKHALPGNGWSCIPAAKRAGSLPVRVLRSNVPRGDFNREGLGIEVDFSLPAERVIRSLNRIIEWRGKPETIRVPSRDHAAHNPAGQWIIALNISVASCWNGLRNKVLPSSTSNPESRSRTPTSSATTAQSGMNGWTNTSLKTSRWHKTSPRNGYGLITTPLMVCRQTTAGQRIARIWASAALHPP